MATKKRATASGRRERGKGGAKTVGKIERRHILAAAHELVSAA